jgi:hypothetical protein
MDLSTLLSIAAIAVSVITLLLTQFQGPDILLINTPEFEVVEYTMDNRTRTLIRQLYPPSSIDLESASAAFVFANHGGKSGTILGVNFAFSPESEFGKFFDRFSYSLSSPTEQSSVPGASMPTTIEAGGNKAFVASTSIYLVDWKRKALANVLEPGAKIPELIESAALSSRKNFESFCDFLSKSNILGTISCTMRYTKGRFKTRVVTEPINNVQVDNKTDTGDFMREFLQVWDNLQPTNTQLFNEMKADIENITRELNRAILELNVEVTVQNLGQRLNFSAWQQLCMDSGLNSEKIRWFIIRSESGLEQELKELYNSMDAYNSLLDDVAARGELKTAKNFITINEERMKLRTNAQEVVNRLSETYQRLIP